MTKTLPLRYAAAVRSIHNILDAQPGGGSNQMFGSLKMLLATVWMNNLSIGYVLQACKHLTYNFVKENCVK